jgi:uncharacterized protein
MRIRVDNIPEKGKHIEESIDAAAAELDIPGYSFDEPLAFAGRAVRTAEDIYVNGRLKGALESQCGRCLNSFRMPLDLTLDVVFAPREESAGEESEDLELGPEISYYCGDSIELLREIKELILVNLPIKPVCRADCKGLCPQCGADLNTSPCRCEQSKGPSPFDKLRDLKFKLEGK